MCLVRSIIANLCPIMIHFNVCRSEEVISFKFLLTLSVPCLLDIMSCDSAAKIDLFLQRFTLFSSQRVEEMKRAERAA